MPASTERARARTATSRAPAASRYSGTFIDGCSRGEHIVDEQDAFAHNIMGCAQGKRLAQVPKAGRARKCDLRVGVDDTHQVSIRYRPLYDRADAVGEEQRLIEFPMPKAVRMEWYRHQKVGRQILRHGLS